MPKFKVGDAIRLVVPARFAPMTSGTAWNSDMTKMYTVRAGMTGSVGAMFQTYYEVLLSDPTIPEPVQIVEEFLEADPNAFRLYQTDATLTFTAGHPTVEAHPCTCDVNELMRGGCSCGAVARYKPPGIIT